MYSSIFILFGLPVLTWAAPQGPPPYAHPGGPGGPPKGPSEDCNGPPPSTGPQVPFKFPLANGFPNISIPSDALTQIQRQAHGTLPNTALPSNVSAGSLEAFKIIAVNEIFEVAYFTSLINNVTNDVPGYRLRPDAKESVLSKLSAIVAQEQLHALGANAILATNGQAPIQACQYVFPVNTFESAIALISTVTDVVLGTLGDVTFNLGINRDTELIPLLSSIIGQEGEQDGWFRVIEGLIPSQLPFLTGGSGAFAASALLQNFIVPGSCPNLKVAVPIFDALTVVTTGIKLADQTLTFSVKGTPSTSGWSVVYINQQNAPVVEAISNVQQSNGVTTFQAQFPGSTNLMEGLTIAAVTTSAGPFSGPEAVAAATKYGPGLIEID